VSTPSPSTASRAVKNLVGMQLGPTDWVEITQEMLDLFPDATCDHQWIHVDVERAKTESPFGGPIARGHLTLSLIPRFLPQLVEFTGFSMGVNHGAERVRFPSPVAVGSELRTTPVVDSVVRQYTPGVAWLDEQRRGSGCVRRRPPGGSLERTAASPVPLEQSAEQSGGVPAVLARCSLRIHLPRRQRGSP
jgi:acyl dehydratase